MTKITNWEDYEDDLIETQIREKTKRKKKRKSYHELNEKKSHRRDKKNSWSNHPKRI